MRLILSDGAMAVAAAQNSKMIAERAVDQVVQRP
jgi:hypothetical protein